MSKPDCKRVRPWWAFPAVIACLPAPPVSADEGIGPPSAILEIIVKFSPESDAGRRVHRLLEEHSQDLSALAGVEERLEASTGVELTRERITSGGEVIFAIPERPLLAKVQAVVARRADVESTELTTAQSANPRLAHARLLVRFRPASDAFSLLKRAYDEGAGGDGGVRALTAELGAASGVPLQGVARGEATLALVVERQALLETLTARIGALDYVDYVQPNAPVQIMPGQTMPGQTMPGQIIN